MKFVLKCSILSFLMVISFSCNHEDELDISYLNFEGDTWVKGPLDEWIYENLTVPYNIEVKYRFDRYELAFNRVLVPPKESQIIPVLETIKKTWIDPYEQTAGSTFIKRYCPKQFILVGSPEYNPNGTIKLGTAEGGRTVVLYMINDFNIQQKHTVTQMLHTIHHEFAHILHQTVMYPEEYRRISTGYTASWNDYSLSEARSKGFITQYSRSSPDEDFVEMISMMLIEGKDGFRNIIDAVPEDAKPMFRQKEQIIARYFQESWNMDIYSLRDKTEEAINSLK